MTDRVRMVAQYGAEPRERQGAGGMGCSLRVIARSVGAERVNDFETLALGV